MPKLFISYSRVDQSFADDFLPLLREVYGYDSVWMDHNLHGGVDWWTEILSQISIADIFVYLVSTESLESPYCEAEYKEAKRLNKIILPVLIRSRTKLPDELAKIQFINLSEGLKNAKGLNKFHAAVSRLMANRPTPPPPPSSSKPVPPPIVPKNEIRKEIRTWTREIVIGLIVTIVGGLILARITGIIDLPSSNSITPTTTGLAITEESTSEFTTPEITPSKTATPTSTSTLEITPSETATPTSVSTSDIEPTLEVTISPTDIEANTDSVIAFVSGRTGNRDIFLISSDGSRLVQLTTHPSNDVNPAFSVDKTLAFLSSRNGGSDIYLMPKDLPQITQLTMNETSGALPAWSPDGLKLVMQSPAGASGNLVIIDPTTKQKRQLTTSNFDFSPSWAPLGDTIVFETTRETDADIYTIGADGSNLRRLITDPSRESQPVWSPDGTLIAFFSDRDGENEIYIANADGTNIRQVTDNRTNDYDPSWSPDGKQIVFASFRDKNEDLYIINIDGTGEYRLTDDPSFDIQPFWFAGSIDDLVFVPRVTITRRTNLMPRAEETATIITQVPLGTVAALEGVSQQNSDWYFIKLSDGQEGFVESRHVVVEGSTSNLQFIDNP